MPLIYHNQLAFAGELGVWETAEDLEILMDGLQLTAEEEASFSRMSDRRKLEWSSARYLVHVLSGRKERLKIVKDAHGKPYLEDSHFNISISHSLNHTAVIASPYNIGIDIQEIVQKMDRISQKFVSERERAHVPEKENLEYLHVIWGAKEAMYKAWGKREIDFKLNLWVPSFHWDGESANFTSQLIKSNNSLNFNVTAKKIGQFILVYAVENSRYVY